MMSDLSAGGELRAIKIAKKRRKNSLRVQG
jgi:hypothetical protein